jgi:DNA-binding response OmpR family regulator
LIILDWPSDHTETLLFVHRIRSGDLFDRRVPILALSALMHHSILEEAWQNKIDDVIGKPVSAIELIKRTAALLDERWTWKPTAGSMAHQ